MNHYIDPPNVALFKRSEKFVGQCTCITRSSKAFGCFSETCMGRTYKQDNLEFSVETSTHFFRRGRVRHTMMFTGYSCKYYRFEWRTPPCNPSFKALALSNTCHEGMRKFHLAVLQLKKKQTSSTLETKGCAHNSPQKTSRRRRVSFTLVATYASLSQYGLMTCAIKHL